MGNAIALYAVINHEGKLRKNRHRSPMIYDTLGKAQAQCRREGDCVVECYVNLDREPLFIKAAKVDGDR